MRRLARAGGHKSLCACDLTRRVLTVSMPQKVIEATRAHLPALLDGGRADVPEEVRWLRPMCGDSAVLRVARARALLPRDALLTLCIALVC